MGDRSFAVIEAAYSRLDDKHRLIPIRAEHPSLRQIGGWRRLATILKISEAFQSQPKSCLETQEGSK